MNYLSWHWGMMLILKKNWLVVSDMVNFNPPNHSKLEKFHFDMLFLSKVYEVWAKKIQISCLSWHWAMMQNLNKPWPCGFKNGMMNWVDFHYSTLGLFLSKAYNVSAKKIQRNYVSWHWKVMQNLKEHWLVA